MAPPEEVLEVMVKAEAGEEVGVEVGETEGEGGGVALVLEVATVAGEEVRWEEGGPLVAASDAAGVVTWASGRRTSGRSILLNSGRRRKR